ncbi:protein of unknown function [Methylocella tundrae]|uniref:Uncharacterized protein n=1 Tax=Methylocella tundrae TaxID=227605 RepID=A0A4U8Z649_METTU|nr:protein of unknown function [Methylocella tundrae]
MEQCGGFTAVKSFQTGCDAMSHFVIDLSLFASEFCPLLIKRAQKQSSPRTRDTCSALECRLTTSS